MTMISGSLFFDERPLVPGEWDYREPGLAMARSGASVWIGGTSSGSLARSGAGLVLAWNGRLDNRDDLLLRVGTQLARCTDADLALAVFERWGSDGLASLVGDWSLAVWDRSDRTLYLARDYMGARPLYYSRDPESVGWSSRLAELVTRTGRRDMLSAAFAAQFMSLRTSAGITPYEGVYAVPPGTCVSVHSSASERRVPFWSPQVGEIRYRDSRTYEEHLRTLWRDALRARLRTDGTVWCELSGGLDSSSVVCMADRLIREGAVATRGIGLVSHATLQSPDGDERRFIAEVERQVGVRSEIVGVEDHQGLADAELAWVTPHALQGVGLATVRRVRAGGGRVVLSGRLGDAVMGCQPDNSAAVYDDLAGGELLTSLRSLRAWSRATRKPFVEIAWRLLAPASCGGSDTGTALLTPDLRAQLHEGAVEDGLRGIRRSKRALARMVLGYASGGRLDVPHHPPDVVYTYPFAHRPLVEFVLAVPGQELSAPGVTRSLMRRAFAGFVPARVLKRQSKGYYPPAAFRAARHAVASMPPVHQLEVVQRGWIDPERLQQAIRTLVDGGGATGGDIHCVLRLEKWLQARHAASAIPQRKEVNTNEVLNA